MANVVPGRPGDWFPAASIPISDQRAVFDALLWMGAVILVVLVAAAVLRWLGRRINTLWQPSGGSFSLDDLRRLRDRGAVTRAEYEALRRKAVEDMHSSGGGERRI